MLIAIAILIPYVLIFLSSMLKWMFGSFLFPGLSTILFVSEYILFVQMSVCHPERLLQLIH